LINSPYASSDGFLDFDATSITFLTSAKAFSTSSTAPSRSPPIFFDNSTHGFTLAL